MDEPTEASCGLPSFFPLDFLESLILFLRKGFNHGKRDDAEDMVLCIPIVAKILVFPIDYLDPVPGKTPGCRINFNVNRHRLSNHFRVPKFRPFPLGPTSAQRTRAFEHVLNDSPGGDNRKRTPTYEMFQTARNEAGTHC